MSNSNEKNVENITLLLKILIAIICFALIGLSIIYNKELYEAFNRAVFNSN
jgi:hypothetical protein